MTKDEKEHVVAQSWKIHGLVEQSYIEHLAVKGDESWPDKQRLLLADMALHLLQTALSPEDIRLDKLKNNIYSILSIADLFLPEAELNNAKVKLYE